MEIKYTTDGKKVVVIGSLNSQEKIVQEVFVSNGVEIPSGENFVVKSLHDAPAVSWKETELKKLEERYERERKIYQDAIDKNEKEYRLKNTELRAKLSYIGLALKNADESSFESLVDFITGEVKWLIVEEYEPKLLEWKDFNKMYEDRLRLFSIFGKDDGTFKYSVGQYYDYSGSNNYTVHPFNNYEDAVSKYREIILGKNITTYTLEVCKQFGFEYPEEKLKEYKQREVDNLNKNIESYTKSIEGWKTKIEHIGL